MSELCALVITYSIMPTDFVSKMATNDPAEDELSIPRASMNKMIKEVLPRIRVANESRELILNCCKEFILLLSSEANTVCNEQNRRTINPDHVLTGGLGRRGHVLNCGSGCESHAAIIELCLDLYLSGMLGMSLDGMTNMPSFSYRCC